MPLLLISLAVQNIRPLLNFPNAATPVQGKAIFHPIGLKRLQHKNALGGCRCALSFSPQMDQDNHNLTFGTANANRTVVLAAARTREAIMEALQNSRYYASQDCNLRLDYKLGNNAMGNTVVSASSPTITIDVTDVNAEPVTLIELYAGQSGIILFPQHLLKPMPMSAALILVPGMQQIHNQRVQPIITMSLLPRLTETGQ